MNENALEQPLTKNSDIDNSAQVNLDSSSGSNFGKFKDAKTLLEAYTNLEAEFTRKSQKLSELQSKHNENAIFSDEESIDNLFESDTDRDKYKKEIEEILTDNNELSNLPNKYQVALQIIKTAESKSAEILNNQEFIDNHIINNEKIKETIISNYLSSLNNISNSPKIISGNPTSVYFSPNPNKPKTLREAGEIFSKMLK